MKKMSLIRLSLSLPGFNRGKVLCPLHPGDKDMQRFDISG